MSNHNAFWGVRFGYIRKDGDTAFVVKQMGTGPSNSGPHQTQPDPNSPRGRQAQADRERFIKQGRPTLYYADGRRVA